LTKGDNLVHVPTGNILLKFALDEIDEFATIIDDIATVLSSNMNIHVHACEHCGTEFEEFDYEEPEGEDLA
jgi:methionine synthase II (cobalamin-independent)